MHKYFYFRVFMKVKVISRNPDDYKRETKHDIHKLVRNHNLPSDSFRAQTEYTRALNATKLERVFAKPFLASLDGHTEGVSSMAKHPLRDSIVLSASRDGQVRIWDLPTKNCLASIQSHDGPLNGVSVDSIDGMSYVTVGQDSLLKTWRLPHPIGGKKMGVPLNQITLDGVAHGVSHLASSTDFVTCGDDVSVWKASRDTPVRTYKLGVNTIHCIKGNPIEEAVIVGATMDRSIWVLDTRAQAPLKKVTMKLRPNAISWNPMVINEFVVANDDYNLYTFDLRHLSHPKNVHMGHTNAVMDVDFAPTGKEFVSGSYDRTMRIFPNDNGHSREVYHTKRMQSVLSVLYSMDNKLVLSGSDEMNIRVWKARAAEKMGPMNPRERAAMEYADKLRETYKEHPQIKRIARHRHVPKSVYSAAKEHRIIKESAKRKESNRRSHAADGEVPHLVERKSHMVTNEEL